ncbi:MAG: nitrous oxide reductase accessory protein NosL [Chitinophagales bacterium]|nr:nitrous oxide reductase accessory protein NosL [Chitinophagales bacterium]
MKQVIISVLGCFSFLFISCNAGPEPLQIGKDNCYTCKMTIMDPKFGAELITDKGKVYKFDDVICLQHFIKSGEVKQENIRQQLVINFEKENDFLAISQAGFLVSPGIKSPMGSQAAAFSTREAAEKYNSTLQGELLSWKELSGKLQ